MRFSISIWTFSSGPYDWHEIMNFFDSYTCGASSSLSLSCSSRCGCFYGSPKHCLLWTWIKKATFSTIPAIFRLKLSTESAPTSDLLPRCLAECHNYDAMAIVTCECESGFEFHSDYECFVRACICMCICTCMYMWISAINLNLTSEFDCSLMSKKWIGMLTSECWAPESGASKCLCVTLRCREAEFSFVENPLKLLGLVNSSFRTKHRCPTILNPLHAFVQALLALDLKVLFVVICAGGRPIIGS